MTVAGQFAYAFRTVVTMVYLVALAILVVWMLLIALMMRQVLSKPDCPECGSDRIESVDMRTATLLVDGQKVPAAWMYRRCHGCQARLKWDVGQDKWVELHAGEWEEVIRSAEEIPS